MEWYTIWYMVNQVLTILTENLNKIKLTKIIYPAIWTFLILNDSIISTEQTLLCLFDINTAKLLRLLTLVQIFSGGRKMAQFHMFRGEF